MCVVAKTLKGGILKAEDSYEVRFRKNSTDGIANDKEKGSINGEVLKR